MKRHTFPCDFHIFMTFWMPLARLSEGILLALIVVNLRTASTITLVPKFKVQVFFFSLILLARPTAQVLTRFTAGSRHSRVISVPTD